MRERVTLYITMFVGVFILISLLGNFILVYAGVLDAENSGVWRPLFDLVAILVGAVAGYIGGVEVERLRSKKDDEEPPVQPYIPPIVDEQYLVVPMEPEAEPRNP